MIRDFSTTDSRCCVEFSPFTTKTQLCSLKAGLAPIKLTNVCVCVCVCSHSRCLCVSSASLRMRLQPDLSLRYVASVSGCIHKLALNKPSCETNFLSIYPMLLRPWDRVSNLDHFQPSRGGEYNHFPVLSLTLLHSHTHTHTHSLTFPSLDNW